MFSPSSVYFGIRSITNLIKFLFHCDQQCLICKCCFNLEILSCKGKQQHEFCFIVDIVYYYNVTSGKIKQRNGLCQQRKSRQIWSQRELYREYGTSRIQFASSVVQSHDYKILTNHSHLSSYTAFLVILNILILYINLVCPLVY